MKEFISKIDLYPPEVGTSSDVNLLLSVTRIGTSWVISGRPSSMGFPLISKSSLLPFYSRDLNDPDKRHEFYFSSMEDALGFGIAAYRAIISNSVKNFYFKASSSRKEEILAYLDRLDEYIAESMTG